MKKIHTGLLVLSFAFFWGPYASGIATADLSTAEIAPTNAGYSLLWDYVYPYKGASSVAVDHYWILTAAHVADDGGTGELNVNGQSYSAQETVYHDTADLALVRFDKPFPGYHLLLEGEIFHSEGSGWREKTVYDELLLVGFGRTGLVTQTTFENGPAGNGIKRWGTNQGNGTETTISTEVGGTAGSVSSACFHMDFDTTDTAYEAGAAQYDSGGPVFIESDGDWMVAGISVYLSGSDPDYTGNYAVKISDYRDWIKSVIADYDSDMDGLPDWWETRYGEAEADADPDEDSFSNYEEWIADTDPNLGSSFLHFTSLTNGEDAVFTSSSNRMYQIEQNLNLTNAAWTAATGWIRGSHPATSVNLSAVDSNLFYRVRAKLP
ncbi:trypsin-like serine protease [Pontiellaceae bacterium B12219]|nr:trypsin-like serine protease [Pontiellaceae bacterium B12219]